MQFIGPVQFGEDVVHLDEGDEFVDWLNSLLGFDLDVMVALRVIDLFVVLVGPVLEEGRQHHGILPELVDFLEDDGDELRVADGLCHYKYNDSYIDVVIHMNY